MEGFLKDRHWRIKRPANASPHWRAICFLGAALVATTFAVLKQPPRTITNFHWITSFLIGHTYPASFSVKTDRTLASSPTVIDDTTQCRLRCSTMRNSVPIRPRPSFETRPARGTPHTVIVANNDDPRQAPNHGGQMSTTEQETRDRLSGSQPHLIRSGSLRNAMVCWTFLIFDDPDGRELAARRRGRTPVRPLRQPEAGITLRATHATPQCAFGVLRPVSAYDRLQRLFTCCENRRFRTVAIKSRIETTSCVATA